MSEEAVSPLPVRRPARSRVAWFLLLLILAFVGYGVFERFQLIADQEKEKDAVEVIREIKGATVAASNQDWRVVFVPDDPLLAKRIGTIYVPYEGEGPDYTKKVTDQLRVFELCEKLILSAGPVSGGMRMGPAPKRVLKPGEVPPQQLDLDAIRKEFPGVEISGDEFLAQAAAETGKTEPAKTETKTGSDETEAEKKPPRSEKEASSASAGASQ